MLGGDYAIGDPGSAPDDESVERAARFARKAWAAVG
jgi:hypothetical protein